MADVRISDLPAASALSDTDFAPLVQVGATQETRRATMSQFRASVQAERPLHVRDYGAVGDGTTDDVKAIQAAIDAAAAQGGGTVLLGPKRYLVKSAELQIKANVTLQGNLSVGAQRVSGDYSVVVFALIVDPASTIRLARNSGLQDVAVLRSGLTPPKTMREGINFVQSFAGTAITIGSGSDAPGTDAKVENVLVLGFDLAILSDYAARAKIREVIGDNRNGIRINHSYDITHIRNVHFWPFLTGNLSNVSLVSFAVSAVANNGSGLIRLTTSSAHNLVTGDLINVSGCLGLRAANGRFTATVVSDKVVDLQGSTYAAGYTSGGTLWVWNNRRTGTAFQVENSDVAELINCFAYGYDTGFSFGTAAAAIQCHNCSVDNHLSVADPLTVGVKITNSAFRTKWVGGFLSSQGTTILVDTTGDDSNQFVGVSVNGGSNRTVDLQNGSLTLDACELTVGGNLYGDGSTNIVYIGANASNLTLLGTDLRSATLTAASDAAMQRVIMLGTREGGGVGRLSAGSLEFHTFPSAALGQTRRMDIGADGIVTVRRRSATAGGRINIANSADQAAYFLSNGWAGGNLSIGGDPGTNPNGGIDLGSPGNATAPLSVQFRRLSVAPAAGDRLANLHFTGMNSASAENIYARISAFSDTITSGSEAGALTLDVRRGSSIVERLRISADGTVTLSGPLLLAADPTAAMHAATRQYVDGQVTERRLAQLTLGGATALTFAAHNNRMLLAGSGTTLSIDWAATGTGFSCMVVNRTGGDLPISLANFSSSTPLNSEGYTKIKANGVASLLVYSPDNGTTKVCHLSGAGVA
ncbi:glycosyl hydrolase family 28-related protein [Roseomonas elaeocarpi]|uniref:Glycosyl hydrolase family 28-related protein n=1 Tax=Roseomonas elaeocarpi TaxID=907779 RepID=A0ABV6JQI5_9PROT